jgi:hypothetical protein
MAARRENISVADWLVHGGGVNQIRAENQVLKNMAYDGRSQEGYAGIGNYINIAFIRHRFKLQSNLRQEAGHRRI